MKSDWARVKTGSRSRARSRVSKGQAKRLGPPGRLRRESGFLINFHSTFCTPHTKFFRKGEIMKKYILTLIQLVVTRSMLFLHQLPARLEQVRRSWQQRAQTGNGSVEVVVWIVAVIVVVGIVAAAVTAFVNGKIALWK